jgi:predicted Rossmann fold flavoprotein
MSKVVVVGGGFAGLVSAITCKKNNPSNEVIILEKLNVPGKKILVTGNGRCNYYNSKEENKFYHSNNIDFIENIDKEAIKSLDFYNKLGIIPTIKDGYYYPYSKEASTIRNALLEECNKLGIKIETNYKVENVIKNDSFIINNNLICDKLIIATGSPCYYKDEDLSGYEIAKSLGHNMVKLVPSLVQLICKGNYFKAWAGIRSDARVSLYIENELIKEERGEVMLTDYGLSGICIFNLSGDASRAISDNLYVRININFLPFLDENIYKFLEERDMSIRSSLSRILNSKLVDVIIDKCNLNGSTSFKELTDDEKDILVDNLLAFKVDVKDTKGFANAQVASGGIDTRDVDKNTMESKIVKGLFFAGEILDVDAICGGYNITFATLSGIKAGIGAAND